MKESFKEQLLDHFWFLLKVTLGFTAVCIIALNLAYFGLFPAISCEHRPVGSYQVNQVHSDSLVNK